ncbi:ABC transporter ATP-binding protein [Candidatus Dependentiae bacterium Noda2021]|nr:ABC transporter ATP-binding protein [Candidatus Dependentiae bacterium Noda2021]
MPYPILEIKNVSKTYKDQNHVVHALNNVSFDIHAGEIFGLLGVNGAGKTTLSSILATVHPATAGDVLFNGVSIYKDLYTYRKALGLCPQIQNLDQFLNVRENLVFAGRYYLMDEKEIQTRVDELLHEFELTRYSNFDVDKLSGGTKQRVLIARALVHKPQIVFLDEPTVGLDPDIRRKLWTHIQALKNQGITVVLTTHYLDEAEILSDRVCMLSKGKVLLVESVAELKSKHKLDRLEDIFLQLTEQE